MESIFKSHVKEFLCLIVVWGDYKINLKATKGFKQECFNHTSCHIRKSDIFETTLEQSVFVKTADYEEDNL